VTPAFAYLRVSGLAQVDGMGFDRQIAAIEKYASANSIEIVKVYREEGITGKSELDGRPALQALIVDLLSNGVRTVLIENLGRLARALIVQETILQDLTRRGLRLISVTEPDACSDDPTRTMIRQILGAFFEYERKMIVSKLADARRRTKSKIGRCEGRKPFGEGSGREEKNTLLIIVALAKSGQRSDEIADYLTKIAAPTRYGGRWHSGTVSKILNRHTISAQIAPKETQHAGQQGT
jgi:DNA invertase Pin-like site-specific DNA recombinase